MEDFQVFKYVPKDFAQMGQMFCRKGTLDTFVVNEQSREYGSVNDFTGKTVLDVGGNIGAFSRYATARGAKSVDAFEPDPSNFRMLQLNAAGFLIGCNNLAVVSDSDPDELELYLASGKNKGQHTLRKVKGRETVRVKTVKLSHLLFSIKPDIMKVDVEGYEYALFSENLPFWPEEIVMEVHLNKLEFREAAETTLNRIREFGEYDRMDGLLKMKSDRDAQDDTVHFWRSR